MTKPFTPDDLDAAIRACVARPSPASLIKGWEQVRSRLLEQGFEDPGPMREEDLKPFLLEGRDAIEEEKAPDLGAIFLEYRPTGERLYYSFTDFDIIAGRTPIYDDDVPVLAVDEESGELTATVPSELLPLLADVRIRDESGSYKLSAPHLGAGSRSFPSGPTAPVFLGSGQESSAGTKGEREVARARIPPELARRLLTRREPGR